MKILVTGMTALQVNTQHRPIQKIDVPAAIVRALREDLRHEVDWRTVTPGERLRQYDLAIVCLAPCNSLNARRGTVGALWTLARLSSICFWDDWQINQVVNAARNVAKKGEKQFFKRLGDAPFYYGDLEKVKIHLDALIAVCHDLSTEEGWTERGWLSLCPMYSWGDRSIVKRRLPSQPGVFFSIDPTHRVIPPDMRRVQPPQDKRREWLLASVMPHDYWVGRQNITWPVRYVGSRKLIVRKEDRLKTERDVWLQYHEHWGALSPTYPQAGSGWFRSRFVYAASARCSLYCGQADARSLGDAYRVTIRDIETAEERELSAIASDQHAQLWRRIGKDTFVEELHNCVEERRHVL